MNVLVACEESQRVCTAFRARGHNAFSADLKDCSGGHPEWHIKGDCIPFLNGNCIFFTQDGKKHKIKGKWGLIIAHPPCTRLCNASQRWLYFGDLCYQVKKLEEMANDIKFFMAFVKADCDKIAIENPVGRMSTFYRPPDQIYNPYDFEGETECKKTCLWLKGLKPLVATQSLPKEQRTHNIFKSHFNGKAVKWGSSECATERAKTPFGVARAMAQQWG